VRASFCALLSWLGSTARSSPPQRCHAVVSSLLLPPPVRVPSERNRGRVSAARDVQRARLTRRGGRARARVVTCLRQWRPKLVETGFQELVFEDALEVRARPAPASPPPGLRSFRAGGRRPLPPCGGPCAAVRAC